MNRIFFFFFFFHWFIQYMIRECLLSVKDKITRCDEIKPWDRLMEWYRMVTIHWNRDENWGCPRWSWEYHGEVTLHLKRNVRKEVNEMKLRNISGNLSGRQEGAKWRKNRCRKTVAWEKAWFSGVTKQFSRPVYLEV